MSEGGYGLGIDIGDATITVAACSPDGERCAEPLRLLPAPADGRIGALMSRVGDPVPLYVDGRPVPPAEVVAATITEVAQRVATKFGAPAARTVVTVPPSWSEHRRQALADALHGCAILTSSAIAVVRHVRATGTVPAAATVAVYDLGASTLDTAVVRVGEDGEIAHLAPAPAPLPWGGRDVDDAVVRHVHGFLPAAPSGLRAACVAAKEALSTQTDVRIEVGERTRPIRLVREDLDELLADAVAESVDALRGAVTGAGLDPAQLDGIVLAGGSARLPAVAEALSAELGRPVLVTAEPELAAACGAAELALDLLDAPAAPTVELAAVAVDSEEDEFPEDEERYDEYDDDTDDELQERRRRRRSIGAVALGRVALVAALFVVLLAAPVTLLAALDSGVLATHGGSTASAADPPPATTAPDSPAAATGRADATATAADAASASGRHSTRGTSASSRTTAARGSTRAGSVAAASSSTADPVVPLAPIAPVVPVDTTVPAPVVTTTDPGAGTNPPVTDPPVTDPPPATNPPVTDPPPATNPPVTDPAPPAGDTTPPATDPGTAQQAAA